MVPRLLVSVRNQIEALVAAQCGVDVIDFKEPDHGPLGMVTPSILSPAIQTLSVQYPSQLVSVACGEATESLTESFPVWMHTACPEKLPVVSYLKLGSSGLKNRSQWIEILKQRQAEVSSQFQDSGAGPARWIAVAYVDHEIAEAPDPKQVVQAAIENSCAGVLFDTFSKKQGTLFDSISVKLLQQLTAEIHQAGGIAGAAGKLRQEDLPEICITGVDLVGIRSAACEHQNRNGAISSEAIRQFQKQLRTCSSSNCSN